MSRAAFLWNPNNASHAAYLDEWKAVAPVLGVEMLFVAVRSSDEFDTAFAAMMRERPDAFTMTADSLHQLNIGWIIDFLARLRPGHDDIGVEAGLAAYVQHEVAERDSSGAYHLYDDRLGDGHRHDIVQIEIGVWQAMRDPKVLLLALNYFGIVTASLGMLIFIPQIIQSLGHSSNMAVGWLTTIPYVCGVIAMVSWGRISDRMNERRWHLLVACAATMQQTQKRKAQQLRSWDSS
jgi:hypothetical protein